MTSGVGSCSSITLVNGFGKSLSWFQRRKGKSVRIECIWVEIPRLMASIRVSNQSCIWTTKSRQRHRVDTVSQSALDNDYLDRPVKFRQLLSCPRIQLADPGYAGIALGLFCISLRTSSNVAPVSHINSVTTASVAIRSASHGGVSQSSQDFAQKALPERTTAAPPIPNGIVTHFHSKSPAVPLTVFQLLGPMLVTRPAPE